MVSLSPSSTSSESFSIRMLGCRVVFSRLAPFLATSTLHSLLVHVVAHKLEHGDGSSIFLGRAPVVRPAADAPWVRVAEIVVEPRARRSEQVTDGTEVHAEVAEHRHGTGRGRGPPMIIAPKDHRRSLQSVNSTRRSFEIIRQPWARTAGSTAARRSRARPPRPSPSRRTSRWSGSGAMRAENGARSPSPSPKPSATTTSGSVR